MLHKCVKIIIFLSTTLVFTGLAYSFYSGKLALPEAAPPVGWQTSVKQGNSIQYGYVTSAVFLNAPKPHIGIVIDGMAFTLLPSTLTWKRAAGVVTSVSHMSALQCCFTTQDKYIAELNSLVLLYKIGSLFGEQEVYVSYDGGFTYTIFYVASTTMQILGGIYRLPVSGNTVALVQDEQYNFYFRNTENWATSQLSESFPLRDPLYMLEVILVAGLRGHLIVWSPQMLLYSPHDGTVLVPVSEFGHEDSAVPPPDVIVKRVTTAGNGAIAVVTSDGGLYYGRLGLKAVVVKFPTNILEKFGLYPDRVMYFDEYTDLVFLEPMFDQHENRVNFRHSHVHVQQQLTQTSAPVISCPVERFSGDFDGKLFYIDKGDSLKLSLDYVPTPNCPFFPVVTLTNADALHTEELIVMDGTTPDGYKTFIMKIGVKLSTAAEADIEEKGLVTISVDLMEREVSCNNVNPQKVHVMMACPPGKHIRVMRNSTACTRGTFTPEQLNNFTYTIPKEVYDPDLLFRPNKAERDLTVKYSYFHHICPLLVYYDMPWRPTFELWDGDTFVEVVKADFVMYEAHGMHNYKYLQTAKTAKCVSQPQDWISMLQKTPYSAWSKQNYRSCKDYNGPPLTNPDAEYQVLSQNSRNKIVFSNYNGMYLFTAVVVDPHYSFCTLTTTFSVYVYGAFPKRILPYGVLCAIFFAILTALLLIGYLRQQNILTKVLRT
ncbi:cation channel sperm-associated protein subunit delta-like isoform X2 [Alosa sapidissima]|uniref:cation channel sperm-associated protein subunit delta-like isoform X2 n=1 Tax=Alosa sapidissima TaxID=34773 RepID=UPI001C0A2F09|nr:cation channel sperm-associated protein subunit delta-like isoform X2 [Alosa sapidissima]